MTTKKTSRKTAKKSFPIWAWLLIAAAATALVFILFQQRASDSQQLPRTVSVEEAAALREEGAFILDVREPSEWEQGHIEGATLIPLGQLLQRSAELPTDQTIVVVCRSGNRSAQGRDILETAGFKAVTSMNGGMNDWQARGYPVVTGP
ncbi:MAG TPA: rhodanese-like domain-containing protein [Anaerolineaceae bacterium]|jgi:rhodanese-related sulfurtransferase|nr:rhodanese-like domain-containing protein [Anaerolineaceae bacterium]HOT25153.1 rhodanese-like domain-containing protein [Anaerolineaceae bacterium]HQH57915.1 rhodanese-like domain-containing protein [Anaerolineaceae bacterium]HQK02786.1 rhodanese-like domain-containing protein [Anaerolineaceae bacterium]